MMNSNQIRKKFLEFFASKGHTVVPSDSLVPHNDPSVLFTSAGMNQFKEQFMGKLTGFRRATSCQKCLRTADLVNVGKSPTHHTFFEMLGNFSFGDYFKEDAISWAWEFVTVVLKLPPQRLWISVHISDDEAHRIWRNRIGIPDSQLVRLGDKDNFWPANAPKDGPNGPCGPCSEIFYDWGPEYGCKRPDCSPACDCKRFSEIWNLVFTQFDRQSDGSLAPLPSKNIDTGMGLERITSVVQNVRENYATDLFTPILETIKTQLIREGIVPSADWMNSNAKAIADHIRAAVVSIGDGVVPSNETRGYVIRKLIRRSIMHLKNAGINRPLCYMLVYTIADTLHEPYPDIKRRHETIAGIIKKEEEMFWTILRERAPHNEAEFKALAENPGSLTEQYDTLVRKAGISEASAAAFVQYDTYGVPLEISKENAQKFGLKVDDDEVEKAMELQRTQSRSKSQLAGEIFAKSTGHLVQGMRTEFIGYEHLECQAAVLALLKGNAAVDAAGTGEDIDVILDTTSFYAESGGQAGDRGILSDENGTDAEVLDTVKVDDVFIHRVRVKNGTIKRGMALKGHVNAETRMATARNHTATHLLQYALRSILGEHVEQSGSAVSGEKLRFDFSHLAALSPGTLQEIERVVNRCIRGNTPVRTDVKNIAEAKASGALAFFGDKYGATVRILSIGDYSKEFCGGTHVKATGEIGLFKITTEYSVAQGIRRIEAVTGAAALALVQEREQIIVQAGELLKTAPTDAVIEAIKKNLNLLKEQERDVKKLRAGSAVSTADTVLEKGHNVDGVCVVIADMRGYDMEALRSLSDAIRGKKDPAVCVLSSTESQKPILTVSISASLAKRGVDAVKIIKEITALAGESKGGGKQELAQAGAKDGASLRKALEQAMSIVEKFLKN